MIAENNSWSTDLLVSKDQQNYQYDTYFKKKV